MRCILSKRENTEEWPRLHKKQKKERSRDVRKSRQEKGNQKGRGSRYICRWRMSGHSKPQMLAPMGDAAGGIGGAEVERRGHGK